MICYHEEKEKYYCFSVEKNALSGAMIDRTTMYEKVPYNMCAQQRLRSACTTAQSDQSSLEASTVNPRKIYSEPLLQRYHLFQNMLPL